MTNQTILIGHGAGGKLTHDLIQNIFVKHFSNSKLNTLNDSSILETSERTAFTTDSYVIDPLFFPGGDIGKIAVSGTVNDLLVSGSTPKYLSAGFIIEEGFSIELLEKIAISMAAEAKRANVSIVTGDTKVVKKGQCDKVFINTAGVGIGIKKAAHLWEAPNLNVGDKIIVSGYLGDHAIAVLAARNNIDFEEEIVSDVAPLCNLILPIVNTFSSDIKFMRDITRGGVATVLNEITESKSFGIEIEEDAIPIREEVLGICEVFGYDPLYLANEGKVLMVVSEDRVNHIIDEMRQLPFGENAQVIGEVGNSAAGRVTICSLIGGKRIVDMLSGEMLPRIC